MAASPDGTARRRQSRYARRDVAGPAPLTPRKRTLLGKIGEYGLLSLPQIARLSGLTEKSAAKHMRPLFDHSLVEVVPVSRASLQDPGESLQPRAALGSGPNVYVLTRKGETLLSDDVLAGGSLSRIRAGSVFFLAHEIEIREFRVWLDLCSRVRPASRIQSWLDGRSAEIDLKSRRPPKAVRPDARFAYRIGGSVLVGLLEVDRGTERGRLRWKEKIAAYDALYRSGHLREATGYANARVLVVAPDDRRRDALCGLVSEEAKSDLAARFWFASRSLLEKPDIGAARWRRSGDALLRPLIPRDLLNETNGESDE